MDTFSIAPAVPAESPEGVFVDREQGNSGNVTAQCVIVCTGVSAQRRKRDRWRLFKYSQGTIRRSVLSWPYVEASQSDISGQEWGVQGHNAPGVFRKAVKTNDFIQLRARSPNLKSFEVH
ncbi:hypothetical protein K466DRAFT_570254 [Polyporus arcularius HHB13444]|uniref:Uncharacterized protein n=1 Tax=Polyporus arcularius HHB13444 TaxID=1314778 RepID=A0A5C3NQ12_9APHY|nr:hypothetical protein K466DRAFT_570254 [Polyporus arcularius HHB13444]